MLRTLSTLSLLLASGIAVAAQNDAAPAPVQDERPTITSFGELRPGGNAFNPVYSFQQIPQKRAVARGQAEKQPETAPPAAVPAQNEGSGEVQEL